MKISGYSGQTYPQPNVNNTDQKAKQLQQTVTRPSEVKVPVELPSASQGANSSVSARIPAEGYAAKLSDAEKKALDAIFARYRENPALAERLESNGTELGRLVDVKV
jgi:hypothetical protein